MPVFIDSDDEDSNFLHELKVAKTSDKPFENTGQKVSAIGRSQDTKKKPVKRVVKTAVPNKKQKLETSVKEPDETDERIDTQDIEDTCFVSPDKAIKKRKADQPKWSKTEKKLKPSENTFVFGLEGDQKKTVLKYWYSVPLNRIPKEALDKVCADLTIIPNLTNYNKSRKNPEVVDESLKVSLYHIRDGCLFVPPYYGLTNFGVPDLDLRRKGEDFKCNFVGQMKPERKQPEAFAAMIEHITKFGSAYLSLPPGYGKTVVALGIASQLKKVTVIIVTIDFLVLQWKERVEQFIPGAKVGIVQGKKVEVEGCDVIIVMLHSILYHLQDPLILDIFKRCGTVIVDESRHISAKEFCKILPVLTCETFFALDGTPYRRDGMEPTLTNWIGPVTFETKREYLCPVVVKVHPISYPFPEESFLKDGDYNRGKMTTDIAAIDQRNEIIVKTLAEYTHLGKQILVLSDRVEQLVYMELELNKLCPEVTTGHLKAGISKKPKLMKEIEKKHVIFATYQLAGQALDIVTLRIEFFATGRPGTSMDQIIPRIIRDTSTVSPIVVDFEDNWAFFGTYFDSRHRYMRNEGYEIEYNSTEAAERHMVKGVRMFERGGWYVLVKDKKEEKATKKRKQCPFGAPGVKETKRPRTNDTFTPSVKPLVDIEKTFGKAKVGKRKCPF